MDQENAESLESEIDAMEVESEFTDESTEEESAPPEETAEQETENEDNQETEIDKKPEPDGFQKRINKRTRDYYTEKAEKEAALAELAKLKSQMQPADPEPQLEDFDYDEAAYQRELAKHYAKQAVNEFKQETTVSREQAEKDRIAAEYAAEIKKSKIPDYHEKIETLVDSFDPERPMPLTMIEAIQLEKNPKVAVYLADNPDKAHDIANMSPLKMATEIGKISAKVSMVKPKKTTKAPDPVQTAGSGGSSSVGMNDPDYNPSMEELEKALGYN